MTQIASLHWPTMTSPIMWQTHSREKFLTIPPIRIPELMFTLESKSITRKEMSRQKFSRQFLKETKLLLPKRALEEYYSQQAQIMSSYFSLIMELQVWLPFLAKISMPTTYLLRSQKCKENTISSYFISKYFDFKKGLLIGFYVPEAANQYQNLCFVCCQSFLIFLGMLLLTWWRGGW